MSRQQPDSDAGGAEREPTAATRDGPSGPYQMSLSLNVLNHLGLNLYSNVPAVLSEAVANAWDADAETVSVDIEEDEDRIVITDDGHGMDAEDVNERFLHVGYRRREDDTRPNRTPEHDRPVMGRKGIGKLSLFSIAETVDVYTTDGEERHAFRMAVEEIEAAIGEEEGGDSPTTGGEGGRYAPTVLEDFPDDLDRGTRIVLTDLKKRLHATEGALRKRLARRFAVLGGEYDFTVELNGDPVTLTDRDYFHKAEFLWTFGDDSYVEYCDDDGLEHHEERPHVTEEGHEIEGWLATAESPNDLVEKHPGRLTEADDLNKVSLMVRGKMAKADLMDDVNDGRMYTGYLFGEIHADFLDQDDAEDIATSNREDIVREDPRYQDLLEHMKGELNRIARQWGDLRNDRGVETARETDAIDTWYESLEPRNRKRAEDLLGSINEMTVEDEEEREELFKHGVLAFENLKYRSSLEQLAESTRDDDPALGRALLDLADLETSRLEQIVQQRLNIVRALRQQLGHADVREPLVHHLRDHPWLLDPTAVQLTLDSETEDAIRRELRVRGSAAEVYPRVESEYVWTGSAHVLVELLPREWTPSRGLLEATLTRDRETMEEVLRGVGAEEEPFEVVALVGRVHEVWDEGKGVWAGRVGHEPFDGGRITSYRTLLDEAAERYRDFLDDPQTDSQTSRLIEHIEAEGVFD